MHGQLNQPDAQELWLQALHDGWIVRLFRDEVISVHQYLQHFFELQKGFGKRIGEIKEAYNFAIQKS